MSRSARRWWTAALLALAVFLGSLGALLARFLVPRPIGLTDNGDGWRLTCQVGAFDGGPVTEKYIEFTYRGTAECGGEVVYLASQVWLARLAQWIGARVGDPAALNLLILGAIGCVIAAVGVLVVTVGLPIARGWRLLVGALVLLVVADSAFFGYLISVVTEGPAFLGIVLAAGGLLVLQRTGAERYAGAVLGRVGRFSRATPSRRP